MIDGDAIQVGYFLEVALNRRGKIEIEGRHGSSSNKIFGVITSMPNWDAGPKSFALNVTIRGTCAATATPDGQRLVHYGTVNQQEVLHTLGAEDFKTRPTGRWRSPATGTVFPMGWTLEIPSLGIDLDLRPVSESCEFDGRQSSYMIYWEGPIRISGSHSGKGFVELSGYGKP